MRLLFRNLFSSQTRSSVLLTLSELKTPVCLNELAELTNCSLCATAAAVDGLVEEDILQKEKVGNETLYLLEPSTSAAKLIDTVRRALETEQLESRVNAYGSKPKSALRFASSSSSFLGKVRRLNDHT